MARKWMAAITLATLGGVAAADGLKNLQVLPKTTTKEEIRPLMKSYAKALDVECDFCHDVPNMASDENPHKKAARQMMRMTTDINEKWMKEFKDPKKVTCGTCHQGNHEPPEFPKKN